MTELMAVGSKSLKRRVLDLAVRVLGSDIMCSRTGLKAGRALVLPFRGKIWVLGLGGSKPVRAIFLARPDTRYSIHTIGFEISETPDFPRRATEHPDRPPSEP